ncbi:MAG: diguanylate cyclase [Gemmatimonadales bacterium]
MSPSLTRASPGLPTAFAAACRIARSDSELFERCRQVLTERFGSDQIWLTVARDGARPERIGGPEGFDASVKVSRCTTGTTDLAVLAAPHVGPAMGPEAGSIALGLATVLEMRAVLQERQGALEEAEFQLKALRQVARLLASVHSPEETEHLIVDFMGEVFFAWWACLYRPDKGKYHPKRYRTLDQSAVPMPLEAAPIDASLPGEGGVSDPQETGLHGSLPAGTELLIPLDAHNERLAVLLMGPRIKEARYGRAERDLAGTLAYLAAVALKNAELVERLESQATTDALTGLPNRRALEARLEAELSRGARHQFKTTIALIDVDRFKLINDSLGHAGGDRYLQMVGKVLSQQVRALDVVGRYGGDEFLVILTMTTAAEALTLVNRLQAGLQELTSKHPEFATATLSFGIAESPRHGRTPAALLAAADSALYAAKHGGRNQVEIARDT